MSAKTVVTTLFVGSLAVAGLVGLHYSQKGDAAPTPKEQVLAASVALPVGTLLREQDVTWRYISETDPDQVVRPSAAALTAQPELADQVRTSVFGAALRRPLAAGEPITKAVFVKPGDREFLQVVLTPGARAIAIPVATGGASTGLLSPGDRVDVVLTQNFKADDHTPLTRRSVGETVVENLRVLAIDTPDAKTAAGTAVNGNFGRTVTLEVSPEDAEKVNVAAELGKLSLTLRSLTPTDSTRLAQIKPKWAGDVSPALYGAGQEKPTPMTPPPPVQVFHGAKSEAVNPNPN